MDTISVGAVIAFAMECYEEGVLSESDTGGRPLRFGDHDAMLWLIEEIGYRRGIGRVLSKGVRLAAQEIGKGAERFAFHIKGQEIPMHDPRGKTGVGLGYATSATGADHLRIPHDTAFQGQGALLLRPLGIQEAVDPLSLDDQKVRFFASAQKVLSLYNSLGVCNFVAAPVFSLSFEKLTEAVEAITGWKTSLWELLRIGERAINMARIFNIREGISVDEDRLFRRMYEPLPAGALEGKRIDATAFKRALGLYYEMMDWGRDGMPSERKMADLDLSWVQYLSQNAKPHQSIIDGRQSKFQAGGEHQCKP
jgi:aldehyde:ferredoxin oxidoreductase